MTDSPSSPDPPPVLEATDARQGRRGKHVLWVLVVSLVLVVLALFGAWAARAPDLARVGSGSASRTQEGANAFNTPEPAARQAPAPETPGAAAAVRPPTGRAGP